MGKCRAGVGCGGVDLAVGTGGHVEQEKAGTDLHKASDEIKRAGLKATMMAAAMGNPADEVGRKVLEEAAGLGIPFYRTDYFQYLKEKSIPESIAFFQARAKRLSALNSELGIVG